MLARQEEGGRGETSQSCCRSWKTSSSVDYKHRKSQRKRMRFMRLSTVMNTDNYIFLQQNVWTVLPYFRASVRVSSLLRATPAIHINKLYKTHLCLHFQLISCQAFSSFLPFYPSTGTRATRPQSTKGHAHSLATSPSVSTTLTPRGLAEAGHRTSQNHFMLQCLSLHTYILLKTCTPSAKAEKRFVFR